MQIQKKQVLAHTALFLVALIYGANYSIAKLVLDPGYLHPYALVLLRVLGALILFGMIWLINARPTIQRSDWGLLVLCSITGVATNQLLFLKGLKLTTPVNAALIMTLTPILVMVLGFMMRIERITWLKVLGLVLAGFGASQLILAGSSSLELQPSYIIGNIYILLNATSYAIYLSLVKRLLFKYSANTVLFYLFVLGFIWVLPFGGPMLVETFSEAAYQDWSWVTYASIGFVIVCTTFLAYLLNGHALTIINPSVVGVYIYLQPLIALIIGLILGKETWHSEYVLIGFLIITGVILTSIKMSQKSI